MGNYKQCWSHLGCKVNDCPVYGKKEPECWTVTSHCFRQLESSAEFAFLACFECEIFQSNAPEGARQLADAIREFNCHRS